MQQRLTDQATLLEAKARSQRAAAETATEMSKTVAEGDRTTNLQRIKLSQQLSKIQGDLSEASAVEISEDIEEKGKQEGQASKAASINWSRSYQIQMNDSAEAAKIQIANAAAKGLAEKQAASGMDVTATYSSGKTSGGDFVLQNINKRRQSGSSAISNAIATSQTTALSFEEESAEYYQKLAESLNAQAVADEAAARDIRAMIASLDAQSKALQGGLSNVAAGKSYTPKKSSSSSGNKGSTAKPQTQKLSKDVRDVYHDVNRELQHQEDKLKDIQDQQKKLLDKDRLQNIQKQNDQLEKQKDLPKISSSESFLIYCYSKSNHSRYLSPTDSAS